MITLTGDIHLSGFIGKPFIARGNRGLENYFINHRYIKSNVVNRAIEEGYRTFVMQHKFPFTVLYLDLPQEKCDVNVHPTKMEFKYDNEKKLFEVCCTAVKLALTHKEIIPKEGEKPIASPVISHPEQKPAEPFEVRRAQSQTIPQKNAVPEATVRLTRFWNLFGKQKSRKLPRMGHRSRTSLIWLPTMALYMHHLHKHQQPNKSTTSAQPIQQQSGSTTAQAVRQGNYAATASQTVQQNSTTSQPDNSEPTQVQPAEPSNKPDLSKMDKIQQPTNTRLASRKRSLTMIF